MNTYAESKKIIDSIRRHDEVLFRMAISHLMDVGIRHLTQENIEATCDEIMKEDDSRFFMTNEFKCDIVRTAGKLAEIDHVHLLTYISREVSYDVGDDALTYKRALQIAIDIIDEIESDSTTVADFYSKLLQCHIDDTEIDQLGYGYAIMDIYEELED